MPEAADADRDEPSATETSPHILVPTLTDCVKEAECNFAEEAALPIAEV